MGKARQYNRRFLQMCSHHLVEGQIACTPASGWEKGQVENQVGNLRDPAVPAQATGIRAWPSWNGWLADQVHPLVRERHKHPEFKDRTIWEVFPGRASEAS